MPVMGRVVKKRARMHVVKGHATLKRAVRKLVIARVLKNRGKTAKAVQARKAGQKALTGAVGHYTRAVTLKSRVSARGRRHGSGSSGSSGGGFLSGILNTVTGILGGI